MYDQLRRISFLTMVSLLGLCPLLLPV